MTAEQLLAYLEGLAEQLEIDVRYTTLDGDGGLCRIKSRRVVMIGRHLSPADRAHVLAAALPADELQDSFLPPAVREAIEAAHGRPTDEA